MKVVDIIDVIEKTAPLGAAAPWDASGIQVAALCREATAVGVMLDPCLEHLEAAADAGINFLLAHHPLSMKPRFPNRDDAYLKTLSLLFSNNTWLYSAHTSLDANPAGPVQWLAAALELENVALLEPHPGTDSWGFGFVGDLPEQLSYPVFCRKLGAAIDLHEWQSCGPKPKQVRRVACCPGAGNSLLPAAGSSGADVFISGDIKHHTALDAEAAGLRVLDVGHFTLEEEMMRRFALQLGNELAVPVVFFPGQNPLCAEKAAF